MSARFALKTLPTLFLPACATVGVLVLATIPALAQDPATDTPTETNFTGLWLLDERYSDDPKERAEELSAARGSRWGTSAPGGFGSGRGGRRSGQPPGMVGSTATDLIEHLARGLTILRVEQSGSQMTLRDANRVTRVLLTDGRTIGDVFGSRTTARLSGGVLTVSTQSDRGQLVETFELARDGTQLVRTFDLQRARLPDLQFRTVYERISETAADRPAATPRTETARLVESRSVPDPPRTAVPVERAAVVDPPPARIVRGTTLRILPPRAAAGELLSGKVLMQTLTIDPAVAMVEFSVDGEIVARQKRAPFDAKVPLADPPREQVVRATAYSLADRRLGSDEIILNRLDPPFRVRLTAIDGVRANGSVTARAEVSVPRLATLEEVSFFLSETEITSLVTAPFVADIPTTNSDSTDYVRVVARLQDGRELEDVKLLEGADFSEVVDVHLVQLQVLVTDKRGTPVTGLSAEDFEIVDHGKIYSADRLYLAKDVALVLGLAIDSSGSMGPIWSETQRAAQQFLQQTLREKDRAFLVDFDSNLRLLQPLTSDKGALYDALQRLVPQGGTALYDSILFSLLQYGGEPGRRALIVLTDGFDSESKADPNRAIDFGKRLGVPVYAITMTAGRMPSRPGAAGLSGEALARSVLSVVTEPTGGRLFQVGSMEQVARAFAQIQDELRKQYVLTYYSDTAPAPGVLPKVRIRQKGLRVKTAVPLDLAD